MNEWVTLLVIFLVNHSPVFQFVYYISTDIFFHPTREQCVNRDSSVDIVTKLRDWSSRNRGSTPVETYLEYFPKRPD